VLWTHIAQWERELVAHPTGKISANANARERDSKNRGRNGRALPQMLGGMFNIRTGLAITPDNKLCRRDGEQTLGDAGETEEVAPSVRIDARLQRRTELNEADNRDTSGPRA
jgi:hypothetical protein